jgi:Mn-dependent DtxR family transcriptional regulator
VSDSLSGVRQADRWVLEWMFTLHSLHRPIANEIARSIQLPVREVRTALVRLRDNGCVQGHHARGWVLTPRGKQKLDEMRTADSVASRVRR